jgi:hypothetical protein
MFNCFSTFPAEFAHGEWSVSKNNWKKPSVANRKSMPFANHLETTFRQHPALAWSIRCASFLAPAAEMRRTAHQPTVGSNNNNAFSMFDANTLPTAIKQ